MKWPKDRRKAFLWAAEAFGIPHGRRTERQKKLTRVGICYAMQELTGSLIAHKWVVVFGLRIGINPMYWLPIRECFGWTPSCDNQRSLFCSLMAALSDKEFEELQA